MRAGQSEGVGEMVRMDALWSKFWRKPWSEVEECQCGSGAWGRVEGVTRRRINVLMGVRWGMIFCSGS